MEILKDKDIKALLIAVNSTGMFIDKYPIGNKELTNKLRLLEERGLIAYNTIKGLWYKRD